MCLLCRSAISSSFFCNYTSTSEIYTYCHTLSLHDARPISRAHEVGQLRAGILCFGHGQSSIPIMTLADCGVAAISSPFITSAKGSLRSEEHTSELQSLTRISYAVFCLKKKTTT